MKSETRRILGPLLGVAACVAFALAVPAQEPDGAVAPESAEAQPNDLSAETLPPTGLDPVEALRQGNQLFRGGRLEAAAEAFRAGWDPESPHPLLAYNLGATLHRLDRLPEAVLWYRRAEPSDDPWLSENLQLARRSLGAPRAPAPGLLSRLAAHRPWCGRGAVALAWAVPLLLLLPIGRRRRGLAATAAVLSLFLVGAGAALAQFAPEEVVLLRECSGRAAELPAGTEAWADETPGGWQIAGLPLVCPEDRIAAVRPDAPH